ncbi:hypothetical protein DFH06DRAFT_1208374 [Mycena polygramma]|nr:hypothetical protein DFH06DRAFT_1208374 [Mycena polygramma]
MSLPDEIISEILSPALTISDDLFSDTSAVSPFAKYSPSTSAYLVVCRDWLRVATPLLYHVVVLRSRSQANALEKVLQKNPEFGRFIKKLRLEGGYGKAIHTVLKCSPNITDIFLSLAIWSSDSTEGLCNGLPLINPRRVLLVDPFTRKPLKNKNLAALTTVILRCISKWENLRVFDFPYCSAFFYLADAEWMARASHLAGALAQSQTIHTVIFSRILDVSAFLLRLSTIPSVRILQLKVPPPPDIKETFDAHPRLKALIRYPALDPPEDLAQIPEIAPSLNPFFIPMQSATDETREAMWNHVLSLVEGPLFPILLVSRYFNRLALPYLYESPNITSYSPSMAQQLRSWPELGAYIRSISFDVSPPSDDLLTIFSSTTNAQKVSAKTGFSMLPDCFEALATTAGSSLRELSIPLHYSRTDPTVFAHFTELGVLELSAVNVKFNPTTILENGLEKLHTIRITNAVEDSSFLHTFSMMKLESLHTLVLNCHFFKGDSSDALDFLNAHGSRLRHLVLNYHHSIMQSTLFDTCKDLQDVEFVGGYPPLFWQDFSCATPHTSLSKVVMDENLFGHPGHVNTDMFPALREIQIRACKWPTTERQISKSDWVTFAEAWLKEDVKLTDSAGQHWIPRVKSSRARKRGN